MLSNKEPQNKIWEIILMHSSKFKYLAAASHFSDTSLTNWPVSSLNYNKLLQAAYSH